MIKFCINFSLDLLKNVMALHSRIQSNSDSVQTLWAPKQYILFNEVYNKLNKSKASVFLSQSSKSFQLKIDAPKFCLDVALLLTSHPLKHSNIIVTILTLLCFTMPFVQL